MNKTKRAVVLLVVIISALIAISVLIIVISKILEVRAKKKLLRPFPRLRVRGLVCEPSKFDLSGNTIRVRNGCFQGYYVFVNPFDSNVLILSRAYTIFQFSTSDSIYRYNSITKQSQYLNVKNGLLYIDSTRYVWHFSQYGTIEGDSIKWSIVERKDKNGFLVWTLIVIDKTVQDPVSTAWIVERLA